MTAFVDLDPMPGFWPKSEQLRAVGWLSPDQPFATGPSTPEFIARLREFVAAAYQPFVTAGSHQCELCQFDGPHGSTNLFLPGDGVLYVSPELIVHYISTHYYQPPAVFVRAVLGAPDPTSMAFKRAFLANGGRALIRAQS